MEIKWSARLASEFIVIVLGVLVALAVDDWRAFRADRELEVSLLERMAADLRADAADLALAQTVAARRLWVLNALTAAADDADAAGSPPDSLLNPVRARELARAVGRGGNMVAGPWRPREDPLSDFWSISEFDLSDDSFQEMLAVGAIRVVTDASLRSSILAYYRTARDMTGNAQRRGSYEESLTEVLATAGIAQGDSLSFADLALMVSRDPRLAVAVRSARFEVEGQLFFFRIIESSRAALESRLAES